MTDQHIAPDDFTFGAVPERKPFLTLFPAPVEGFTSDAHLRRWCVEQVCRSQTTRLFDAPQALYDFMRASAQS